MRTASKIILALPAVAVGLDTALWHFPFYVACVVLGLCLVVLAVRAWHWLQALILGWCIRSQQEPADFEEL